MCDNKVNKRSFSILLGGCEKEETGHVSVCFFLGNINVSVICWINKVEQRIQKVEVDVSPGNLKVKDG